MCTCDQCLSMCPPCIWSLTSATTCPLLMNSDQPFRLQSPVLFTQSRDSQLTMTAVGLTSIIHLIYSSSSFITSSLRAKWRVIHECLDTSERWYMLTCSFMTAGHEWFCAKRPGPQSTEPFPKPLNDELLRNTVSSSPGTNRIQPQDLWVYICVYVHNNTCTHLSPSANVHVCHSMTRVTWDQLRQVVRKTKWSVDRMPTFHQKLKI